MMDVGSLPRRPSVPLPHISRVTLNAKHSKHLIRGTGATPIPQALGIFDRATAVHRSVYIGGEDEQYQRKAFGIGAGLRPES